MGNRAIVLPEGSKFGVYLHWNGGPDSVKAFLEYCKLKHHRDFGGSNRDSYGLARFCQVVGNFFGGTCSIGVEAVGSDLEQNAEWLDNGIYVVRGWDVVKRIGTETQSEGYDLMTMLLGIDERQPEKERLGEDYIRAKEVDASELNDGDEVYLWDGVYDKPLLTSVENVDGAPRCVDQYGHYQYLIGIVRRKENKNGEAEI